MLEKLQIQPRPCFSCLQRHGNIAWKVLKNTSNGNVVKANAAQNKFLK